MVSELVKVTKHALNHNIFVHLLSRIFWSMLENLKQIFS